ncbi:MAG: S8 family serine peptidase [Sedimentisphaerales bacterium]
MKKLYLILGIMLLAFHVLVQAGLGDDQLLVMDPIEYDGPGHVPDEIIVKFKPGVSRSEVAKINSQHGTSVIYTSPFAGFKRFKIPKGLGAAKMVEILSKNPNVEYAELNYVAYALMVPNDPYYSPYQWHLDNPVYGGIGMEEAWDLSSGVGVTVAVIDTGVAYEDRVDAIPIGGSGKFRYVTYKLAPDLAKTTFVPGYDFVNDDDHPNDDQGHGTHVTGTIAQSTNNNIGVAGVAYNCSIMPIKVLNSSGSGTYADIADGIYFAANNGAEVINMSLGGSSGSITLMDAVAYAHDEKSVTIVCSSGNEGSATTVLYPAAYDDYCIAVGATNYLEQVTGYSNCGASLDLTAPGGDGVDNNGDGYMDGVLQQTHNGSNYSDFGYYFYTGTSMAAPHVSGVAALLISNGVATTPDQVRGALESTAEDKGAGGWDSEYGWGIIDAYAALHWNSGPVDNPPTVTITNPTNGGTVSGIVNVTADAIDDNGVMQVEFFVNGGSIGVDNASPYGVSWNSASVGDGSFTISATATDTAIKTGSDAISVTVDNTDSLPIVAIVYPAPGSTVSGVIDVVADATDDNGVTQVEFFVNGGSIGVDSKDSDGWSASWDTTGYTDGSYTVSAEATDTIGQTDGYSVSVTVDNSTPQTSTMYVWDIFMDYSTAGPNYFIYTSVTIVGEAGPVSDATVYLTTTLEESTDSTTGITGSDGTVTFKLKSRQTGTYTSEVTNVTHASLTYEPSLNVKTNFSLTVP